MTENSHTPTAVSQSTPPLLHPLSVGAKTLGQSEDWYIRQLRAGALPGHKVGRLWRLTDADIAEAIQRCGRPAAEPVNPWNLSPGSLRRSRRRAAAQRASSDLGRS